MDEAGEGYRVSIIIDREGIVWYECCWSCCVALDHQQSTTARHPLTPPSMSTRESERNQEATVYLVSHALNL